VICADGRSASAAFAVEEYTPGAQNGGVAIAFAALTDAYGNPYAGEGDRFCRVGVINTLGEPVSADLYGAVYDGGGVLTEIKGGVIKMAALDGFRMAVRKEAVEGIEEDIKMVISGRIMNEIGRILSDSEKDSDDEEEEKIKISVNEKRAFISIENTNISARLMEGEFIKYEDIIPKENAIRVEVDRRELIECIDRASIIVKEGKNSFIRFKIEGNEMVLTSRAEEGTTRESINLLKEGEDIEIGFNGRFLGEPLKAVEDDRIELLFNKNVSPCIIRPLKGDSYEYLVLPVRLGTTGEQ
jgi:DNA polymerase-3 subunit beta